MSSEANAAMQIQGNLFNEMVMEEAIKDKTVQVQKQMEDEQGNIIGHNQGGADEKESDSDFNSDGDDEMFRSMRDVRMAALKVK